MAKPDIPMKPYSMRSLYAAAPVLLETTAITRHDKPKIKVTIVAPNNKVPKISFIYIFPK